MRGAAHTANTAFKCGAENENRTCRNTEPCYLKECDNESCTPSNADCLQALEEKLKVLKEKSKNDPENSKLKKEMTNISLKIERLRNVDHKHYACLADLA